MTECNMSGKSTTKQWVLGTDGNVHDIRYVTWGSNEYGKVIAHPPDHMGRTPVPLEFDENGVPINIAKILVNENGSPIDLYVRIDNEAVPLCNIHWIRKQYIADKDGNYVVDIEGNYVTDAEYVPYINPSDDSVFTRSILIPVRRNPEKKMERELALEWDDYMIPIQATAIIVNSDNIPINRNGSLIANY